MTMSLNTVDLGDSKSHTLNRSKSKSLNIKKHGGSSGKLEQGANFSLKISLNKFKVYKINTKHHFKFEL